ncbi:hypothetical protein HZ326_0868 [Fusarium oxysporum f. sp. albedinis]|nr:hypothetical protein HZ326_0868 [Fusarium oxysporum f. sp. albedinis]
MVGIKIEIRDVNTWHFKEFSRPSMSYPSLYSSCRYQWSMFTTHNHDGLLLPRDLASSTSLAGPSVSWGPIE